MVDARGDIILAEKPIRLISDVVSRIDDPLLLCNDLLERCRISNVTSLSASAISVDCRCVVENGEFNDQVEGCKVGLEQVSVVKASGAKSDLKPQRLAKVFDISLDDAIETLRRTERFLPRNTMDITLDRRNNQDGMILRYKRMKWPYILILLMQEAPDQ